jgi:hypothetical protein
VKEGRANRIGFNAISRCRPEGQAATAVGGGIGVTFIFFIWFIVFVVLSIIWFMTRGRTTVVVYGPQGQQASVAESEAKKRVEKQGWSYTPRVDGGPGSTRVG